MAPGHDGRPLRARFGALYFLLYGYTREDADYMLDTCPIVRLEGKAPFVSYRTRELILACMNALAADDTQVRVAIISKTGGDWGRG